jgi:hypothetical protein
LRNAVSTYQDDRLQRILSLAVPFALRVDQKQHADGSPIALEHVSEAREAVRHLSFGLSA